MTVDKLRWIAGLVTAVTEAAFFISATLGMSAAIGVAILRYHLYDIDRLINRTLVYGPLTATLITTNLVIVLGRGGLARQLTGESSSLVVAASTLAVAGLFRPMRGNIQAAVDRHFYRRKYDAAQTLEHFRARLRDEIDLGTLDAELSALVQETMQPAHVSRWLNPAKYSSNAPSPGVPPLDGTVAVASAPTTERAVWR